MYKLIEWIRLLTDTTDAYSVNSELASVYTEDTMEIAVNRKRHSKYFQRCLDVLPPRLASHDSTRFVIKFFVNPNDGSDLNW